MPQSWIPFIGTLLIQIIGCVYIYGRLSQANAEHARRLDRLEEEQGEQWTAITATSNRVAELHGRVK
jgi:putative Mn2+ efflux pump MntP